MVGMAVFRCKECEKNFSDERALEQHNGQKHDEEKNRAKAALEAEKVKAPVKSGIGFPVLIIGVLVIFAVFAFVLYPMMTTEPQNSTTGLVSLEPQAEPVVREITMIAKQWSFEPATITVNKGDTVKLTIDSVDVAHGFAISAFGVDEQLTPGEITAVEFVADKKGSYRFFCSVQCGQGHGSMSGLLIVK